jgi:hypothetical protein
VSEKIFRLTCTLNPTNGQVKSDHRIESLDLGREVCVFVGRDFLCRITCVPYFYSQIGTSTDSEVFI